MGEFSLSHWLIIAVILLLFMGPSKLPALGKSLGEAIRGFKKGLNTDSDDHSNVNRQITQDSSKSSETASNKESEKIKS